MANAIVRWIKSDVDLLRSTYASATASITGIGSLRAAFCLPVPISTISAAQGSGGRMYSKACRGTLIWPVEVLSNAVTVSGTGTASLLSGTDPTYYALYALLQLLLDDRGQSSFSCSCSVHSVTLCLC